MPNDVSCGVGFLLNALCEHLGASLATSPGLQEPERGRDVAGALQRPSWALFLHRQEEAAAAGGGEASDHGLWMSSGSAGLRCVRAKSCCERDSRSGSR